jgi:hypothetical protein
MKWLGTGGMLVRVARASGSGLGSSLWGLIYEANDTGILTVADVGRHGDGVRPTITINNGDVLVFIDESFWSGEWGKGSGVEHG